MEENKNKTKHPKKEPNVLPATEVVKNPNPRANENILGEENTSTGKDKKPGSEITDGEDG
jgi:hypothetical protein